MECVFKLALVLALMSVVSSRLPIDILDRRIPEERRVGPIRIRPRLSDRVIYKREQGTCVEETESATRDCRWAAGLYPFVDHLVKKGKIVAYKIKWWSGRWTGWFVPGVNDVDLKFNPSARSCSLDYKANSLRRMWSYFYDHTHKYIICKN